MSGSDDARRETPPAAEPETRITPETQRAAARRAERRAAALRENLQRRKAQARARDQGGTET
jgi:hypothetical protein